MRERAHTAFIILVQFGQLLGFTVHRAVEPIGSITSRPVLGGLHHQLPNLGIRHAQVALVTEIFLRFALALPLAFFLVAIYGLP